MKYGLLAVSTGVDGKINIGDYIQAVAAQQFLPTTDLYLERESDLHDYKGEITCMIMNGWYMNHPENWPPSDHIVPLYVAVHINRCGLPGMLSPRSISYFKEHEPIGCRDINTMKLLSDKGVESYFSGCLTLTLGKNYKSIHNTGKVYIVEPYTVSSGLLEHHKKITIETFIYLLRHISDVMKISRKKEKSSLKSYFYNAYFLKQYSRVFDYKMLVEAEYINQYNYDIQKKYPTNEDKINYAKELIHKYSEASCVITSRIHCALPCLGLETRVIFIELENDNDYSTARFGGLKELFNVLKWDGLQLHGTLSKEIINKDNFPQNKNGWKCLADKMITTCESFVNNLI